MNIADELLKLEELHNRGALDDAEFAQAKAALLRSASAATPAPTAITPRPPPPAAPPPNLSVVDRSAEVLSLPEAVQGLVRGELTAGEKVRWAGQPSPARFAARGLLPALFGIPFTGFAIFWIAKGFEMQRWRDEHFPGDGGGMDSCFPLFGVPFVLVGLGLLGSPLWLMLKAQGTAYVVTDRRAIVFDGGWSTHVRSFGPQQLGQIEKRQHGDGSGDLILAKELHYTSGHYSGTPGQGGRHVSGGLSTREVGFFGIPEVMEVERLLLELASRGGRGEDCCPLGRRSGKRGVRLPPLSSRTPRGAGCFFSLTAAQRGGGTCVVQTEYASDLSRRHATRQGWAGWTWPFQGGQKPSAAAN